VALIGDANDGYCGFVSWIGRVVWCLLPMTMTYSLIPPRQDTDELTSENVPSRPKLFLALHSIDHQPSTSDERL
jgi:hypothetical protein